MTTTPYKRYNEKIDCRKCRGIGIDDEGNECIYCNQE